MSTTTIVAVALWNLLLLTALTGAVVYRGRALGWITSLDEPQDRSRSNDEEWSRFLSEHPELVDQ